MSAPVDLWPLFGLRLRTSRLVLEYPDDARLAQVMEVATAGVHDPGTMPFSVPWTRTEPPELQRNGLAHFWGQRASTGPAHWELPFVVLLEGRVVGVQALRGKDFSLTRTVSTGSWLGLAHQGQGVGKEMRNAVLALAFEHLGAQRAITTAFADNPASQAVTRALGYRDDGWYADVREGRPARHLRFVLEREEWRSREPVTVEGLEPCLGQLGVSREPGSP